MRGAFSSGLLIALLAASPAAADWLVLRAGGRVETKGPWQTRGKLIVFTRADGSLSSLRLAEVDLEASRKASEEAKTVAASAAAPAPQPPPKKLAVLTDKDFPKPQAKPAEEAKAEGKDQAAKPAETAGTSTVTVASWKRLDRPGSDGLEIQGTLQNNSDKIAAGVAVEVQLYDEAGDRVATAQGLPATPSIQPHSTVEFRATFLGVFTFAAAKFETKGYPLDISPAAPDQEQAPPPQ